MILINTGEGGGSEADRLKYIQHGVSHLARAWRSWLF